MFVQFNGGRSSVKSIIFGVPRRTGVTLIELLVVIVLLAIVLSLAIVGIEKSRKQAVLTRNLTHMRTVAAAVVHYSFDNRDLPPTLLTPPTRWPETWQTVYAAGVRLRGSWFADTSLFYMLFDPFLPEPVLRGGYPWAELQQTDRGTTVEWIPYRLTSTLYAAPEYWIPERQRPLLGWGPQRFDSVAMPAQKGMCYIPRYGDPATLPRPGERPRSVGEVMRVPFQMRVAWFDLSVTQTPENELEPGVANRFSHGVDPIRTTMYDRGTPVGNTRWGLAGIDRK